LTSSPPSAPSEDITRDQLHIYAVGFQELTGQRADILEVLNLDQKGKNVREMVNESLLTEIRDKDRRGRRRSAYQPAAPPPALVLDVRRLRPGRPVQESPVIVIDRFIEPCYSERSFDSLGRGRGGHDRSADHIKALVRAHAAGDESGFYSVALQMAAGRGPAWAKPVRR